MKSELTEVDPRTQYTISHDDIALGWHKLIKYHQGSQSQYRHWQCQLNSLRSKATQYDTLVWVARRYLKCERKSEQFSGRREERTGQIHTPLEAKRLRHLLNTTQGC